VDGWSGYSRAPSVPPGLRWAVNGRRPPALIQCEQDCGSVVLCTYPVHHMAAVLPRVTPETASSLYRALAVPVRAGVNWLVRVDVARVAARLGAWALRLLDCDVVREQ
jgi:hypothetical protein